MSSFTVTIHAQLVRQGLESLAADIPVVGRRRIYLRMLRMRTRLAQPAPKPSHPIEWDSLKQKRAYFASDGFGAGIPYQRKGDIERAWQLQPLDDGYRLANEKEQAYFVFGDMLPRKSQSRIHANTWPLTKTVAFEELDQLPQEIQADIDEARKRAGL